MFSASNVVPATRSNDSQMIIVSYSSLTYLYYHLSAFLIFCSILPPFFMFRQNCHLWIWQDLLDNYVEAMIIYYESDTIRRLQEEHEDMRKQFSKKNAVLDDVLSIPDC